jgi:DNA-binding transcriptional MerR regulator
VATTETGIMTVGQVAAHFRVAAWQVRRLYEAGKLPPAERVGAYRVVRPADLPRIAEALRAAGYLTEPVGTGTLRGRT